MLKSCPMPDIVEWPLCDEAVLSFEFFAVGFYIRKERNEWKTKLKHVTKDRHHHIQHGYIVNIEITKEKKTDIYLCFKVFSAPCTTMKVWFLLLDAKFIFQIFLTSFLIRTFCVEIFIPLFIKIDVMSVTQVMYINQGTLSRKM